MPKMSAPAIAWTLAFALFAGAMGYLAYDHYQHPARELALTFSDADGTPVSVSQGDDKEVARPTRTAPDLSGGVAWLNTDKPINLADLKGRVVLLDFWTLCCINCIHTLPDLAKLEAKYPGVLVVLGVHTPKFENEKNTESIKKAILRYEIKHPVVNDADMKIWRRYRVNSWPTLVLIDPDGNYVGQLSGEGGYEVLDHYIGKLVKDYKARKLLKENDPGFKLVQEQTNSALFFPGKVLADSAGKRLFISDSTNHRIVITSLEGKKIAVAGNGSAGWRDGAFDDAQFSDPQGMAIIGETLYVADRRNHVIRALDLANKTVKTVAGVGTQDRESRGAGGPARKTGLNSPWDLLVHKGKMFVAMAGHHQIWTFDPEGNRVEPYAGSGREDLVDGPLARSAFAQPSGLTTDGKTLYVADSEISAIRALPVGGAGMVSTVVGEGLFEFGDRDGTGSEVRLQHALGVIFHEGKLYVADTYNSKIKLIDPEKRTCTTWLAPAVGSKEKILNEPGGLSIAGGKMYIADTNNHRIRVVDMATKAVSDLQLQGVEPVRRKAATAAK